jgi:hypothetical protein
MAESHIGCYKTELIIPDGPWPMPPKSSWPRWNGSGGTTPNADTPASTTSPRCRPNRSTPTCTPATPQPQSCQPWWQDEAPRAIRAALGLPAVRCPWSRRGSGVKGGHGRRAAIASATLEAGGATPIPCAAVPTPTLQNTRRHHTGTHQTEPLGPVPATGTGGTTHALICSKPQE